MAVELHLHKVKQVKLEVQEVVVLMVEPQVQELLIKVTQVVLVLNQEVINLEVVLEEELVVQVVIVLQTVQVMEVQV